MTISEFEEVKSWFRNLRISLKTLNEKIDFYNDLVAMSEKLKANDAKIELDKKYYLKRITEIETEIRDKSEILEQCFSSLDEAEKNIITLKCMKGIGWDYINMHSFFSKSQAIRVYNSALKKIVKNKTLYRRITGNGKEV